MFTLSDGDNYIHLPPVQDYKRAYDNNEGPNTGGMGSIMDNFDFLNNNDILNCEKLNEKVSQKKQVNNILRQLEQSRTVVSYVLSS